jgi:cellulose biosynthesis protein BcsQ
MNGAYELLSRALVFVSEIWQHIKIVSTAIKPYSDVIRPLHDFGVVTATVVFAAYQFVTKRNLKHKLDAIERALSGDEDEPWLLHHPKPYKDNKKKFWPFAQPAPETRDTKYICVFNLKGGVGKTTLAENLAAFFDRALNKDVLLLDLDYQGSLSNAMLSACEISDVESQIDWVFGKGSTSRDLLAHTTSLQKRLPRTRIVTSHYPFGKLENQLHLKWLIEENYHSDIRQALARVVRSTEVKKQFDVVIFDAPPRLTTGAVNALCAATHLLVPTVLDKTSAEAVGPTLVTLRRLIEKLNPELKLLGVVGNLTRLDKLEPAEEQALGWVRQGMEKWGKKEGRVFERTIPRRKAVIDAAGRDIAYLANDEFQKLFDKLGYEIADELWPEQLSSVRAVLENAGIATPQMADLEPLTPS